MVSWSEGHWRSHDGLKLHYRDYPGGEKRPPIMCIPGLTRNARDFEGVAARLAGEWRLICVDLRGRGESAWSPDPASYVPLVYLQDLEALLAALGLDRFIVFGTSLGGLMAMMLAAAESRRLAGVLLNDIGPDVDEAGLTRIRSIVGKAHSWLTWLHAARFFAETQRDIHPRRSLEQWLVHAKRVCRLNAQGRITLDYDMRIAEPFKTPQGPPPDLWPLFGAFAGIPLLTVRGALSDILSESTVARMKQQMPQMDSATIPGVGHAPTLEEPEAVAAIDRLLGTIGR